MLCKSSFHMVLPHRKRKKEGAAGRDAPTVRVSTTYAKNITMASRRSVMAGLSSIALAVARERGMN